MDGGKQDDSLAQSRVSSPKQESSNVDLATPTKNSSENNEEKQASSFSYFLVCLATYLFTTQTIDAMLMRFSKACLQI